MSLKPLGAWYFTTGLMGGSTLVYLLTVLAGLALPSWPFNAFFAPLAMLVLVLQLPYLWRPVAPYGQRWRLGAGWGAAALALVWLFYHRGWST